MKQVSRIVSMVFAVALVVTAIAMGCASAPLRTEESTSGIRAAEEVGAAEVPQASLHLQLAKEELARAKQLSGNDEKEQADSMIMRAEADSALAVALARGDDEMKEAQEAVERVRQLRRDNP